MGMRYLRGDLVVQDMDEARKWLQLAAGQNYTLAIRKLAELDAPPAPPKKKK
jgi:TPR repeat protein